MKPSSLRIPQVCHHKAKDVDFIVVRSADGKRRPIYLGKHGSAAAARRAREVLSDILAGKPIAPTRQPRQEASACPSVAQMVLSFLLHAERYYAGPDGSRTRSVANFAIAFAPLLHLHRDTPVDRFTVRDLADVRQATIDRVVPPRNPKQKGRAAPKGLCRRTVNDRVQLVRQLFKWGTEQRIVPGAVWHELSALRGIPIGREGVHDNAPVEAVPWKLVADTLPHLTPTVAAAVQVQWFSGMRPAEVLAMTRRRLEVGKDGKPWIYTPTQHKGSWRGQTRVVALGPKAQALLRPLLQGDPDAALFSPQRAWQEHLQQLREQRQCDETKQTKDRDDRREKADPCLPFFDVPTYRRAIHRACDKAGVPHWSPHRLRHAAGTRLVLEEGLEAARAALGHTDARMTRRYAVTADSTLACAVAARHG